MKLLFYLKLSDLQKYLLKISSTKVEEQINGERLVSLRKWHWNMWISICKKTDLKRYSVSHTKINSKRIQELNVKLFNCKATRKNKRKYLL